MSSTLSMDDISVLDRQIEQLYDYKPIAEHEVKALCEKVSYILNKPTLNRQKKFFPKRVTCSR